MSDLAEQVARMYAENPDYFISAVKPDKIEEVSDKWQKEIRFRVAGIKSRDAKAVFEPEQIKAWGAKRFKILYDPNNVDLVIFKKIDTEDKRQGNFTITQIKPHRIGNSTLTWSKLRHYPRFKEDGKGIKNNTRIRDNKVIYVPCDILGEFFVVDLGALEFMEPR